MVGDVRVAAQHGRVCGATSQLDVKLIPAYGHKEPGEEHTFWWWQNLVLVDIEPGTREWNDVQTRLQEGLDGEGDLPEAEMLG